MSIAAHIHRAPFPWFGSKARCAAEVWEALGDVHHYVEPFAGSLAVLLNRPDEHAHTLTTANDADGNLACFWRSMAIAPEEVARWADWPVSEIDSRARHRWLVETLPERRRKLEEDPDYYDAKAAGWWVWGTSCAIVPGLFGSPDSRPAEVRRKPALAAAEGRGVQAGRMPGLPHLSSAGQGETVHALSGGGAEGPNGRPCLARPRGVNRDGVALEGLAAYMEFLARRLRRVRVCCGDWTRVVSDGVLNYGGSVGVFLDPPYDDGVRTPGIYAEDSSPHLSSEVRAWAIAKGDDPRIRIVLAGYHQEHADKMPGSWRMVVVERVATPYASTNKQELRQERLWLSPHCLSTQKPQRSLFAERA